MMDRMQENRARGSQAQAEETKAEEVAQGERVSDPLSALRATQIKFPKLNRMAAIALGGAALNASAPKAEPSVHLAHDESVHEAIGIDYAKRFGSATAKVYRSDGKFQASGGTILVDPRTGKNKFIMSAHAMENATENGFTLQKIVVYPGHVNYRDALGPHQELESWKLYQGPAGQGGGNPGQIDLLIGSLPDDFATMTASTAHEFKPPYFYSSIEKAQAAAETAGRETVTLAEAEVGTHITSSGPGEIFRPPSSDLGKSGYNTGYYAPLISADNSGVQLALSELGLSDSWYIGTEFYGTRNIDGAGGMGTSGDSSSGGWFKAQTASGSQVCLGYMSVGIKGGWHDNKYWGGGWTILMRLGKPEIAEFIYNEIIPTASSPQSYDLVQLSIQRNATGNFLIRTIDTSTGSNSSVQVQVQSSPTLNEGAVWTDVGSPLTLNDSSTFIEVPFNNYEKQYFFRGVVLGSEQAKPGQQKRAAIKPQGEELRQNPMYTGEWESD